MREHLSIQPVSFFINTSKFRANCHIAQGVSFCPIVCIVQNENCFVNYFYQKTAGAKRTFFLEVFSGI